MLTEDNKFWLRDKFCLLCDETEQSPLKTIGLVGAMPEEDSELGLWPVDVLLLGKALETLKSLGIPVYHDFEAKIVNINEEFGGYDYLTAEPITPFDVSIFCYIKRIYKESERTRNKDDFFIRNSDAETKDRHSWLKAAKRHQSKVIVTHGKRGGEVTSLDFKGDKVLNRSPYRVVHSAPHVVKSWSRNENVLLDVMFHRDLQ